MNRSLRIWIAVLVVSLIGLGGYSFAFADSAQIGGQKSSRSVVGVVTDISGTTLTIIARDNNTYAVDAVDASIVTGFIGPWSKPSSLSDIRVADTLTVIGEVNATSIHAAKIAHNKTPQNVSANNQRLTTEPASKPSPSAIPSTLAPASEVSSTTEGTSTGIIATVQETVGIVVDKVLDLITGTTTSTSTGDQTSDIGTSTLDTASTSTQLQTSSESGNASSSSDNI